MSYVLNPSGSGDEIEGEIAPDQVAYGDPDNAGKIKGSDNFTFVDETGGSGPTVELTGDSPQLDMQDDTAATDYKTRFKQSGASLFVFGQDSTGTDVEMIRAQPTSIVFNDDGNNLDFRHEAQGGGALLWSDAGRASVGIGTQPDSAVQRLHVDGDSADTSTTDPVVLIENDASGRDFTALELKNKSDDPNSDVTFRMTSLAQTDSDFEIRHDSFGGTTFITGQPETVTRRNLVMSNTIFNVNADQADIDTQIESTGVAAMFHVDAANDNIGIGTTPASSVERLDIAGTQTGTRTVRISTNAPVAEKGVNGPYFDLTRRNSDDVGQVNSNLGIMRFIGEDSASNDTVYAYLAAEIYDPTDGSEDGVLKFNIIDAGTNTEYMRLTARDAASPDFKGVVINETSADVSFRVESDGINPAFMVDAAQDNVGIGTAPASNVERLHIKGTGTGTLVKLVSTGTGGAGAPDLVLHRNNPSPSANDDIGEIKFNAENSNGDETNYATIYAEIPGITAGSEAGRLRFYLANGAGGQSEIFRINSESFVVNEIGEDIDFRAEGLSVQSLLRTNAAQDNVGIGTNPTSGLSGKKPMLHVKAEDDNIGILIEDDAADSDMGPEMVLYRSSGSPAVNDLLGRIRFEGQDSGGNPHTYFRMSSQIKDPTDASEDGNFFFTSRESGALFDVMKINGASLEINPNTNSNINFNVRTNLTTQAQSFFRTYNSTTIGDRYTEVLRGSKTVTSTPVNITATYAYGSNTVTDTGASVLNLPEAVPGMHLQVVNKNISGISVAPASGETINGSTGSYSVSHNWTIAKFICIAAGEWVAGEAN